MKIIARLLFLIICTIVIVLMLIQTVKDPGNTKINKIATIILAILAEISLVSNIIVPVIMEKKENHKDH